MCHHTVCGDVGPSCHMSEVATEFSAFGWTWCDAAPTHWVARACPLRPARRPGVNHTRVAHGKSTVFLLSTDFSMMCKASVRSCCLSMPVIVATWKSLRCGEDVVVLDQCRLLMHEVFKSLSDICFVWCLCAPNLGKVNSHRGVLSPCSAVAGVVDDSLTWATL